MNIEISVSAQAKNSDAQTYVESITRLPVNKMAVISNDHGFIKFKYRYAETSAVPFNVAAVLSKQFGPAIEPPGMRGHQRWKLGQGREITISKDVSVGVMWITLKDKQAQIKIDNARVEKMAGTMANRHGQGSAK